MKHIVVAGGGFAGFWSAAGAARKLEELDIGPDEATVTLIEKNAFHSIRVRNYEENVDASIIPLSNIVDPIGVKHVQGEITGLDTTRQVVFVTTADGPTEIPYDRLVYALGSELNRPPIPGLTDFTFDVDTYEGAKKLEAHLLALPSSNQGPHTYTALVVGAGLTGIETAFELPARLKAIRDHHGDDNTPVRVILADGNSHVGSDMGEQAQAVIDEALSALNIEPRVGIRIAAVSEAGATLADGECIPAATIVWCAGMRANPLGDTLPVDKDRAGRVLVDEFMRVKGLKNVFAAGDVACAMVSEGHESVMSCQHGRPMGRFAGHNVVADLYGEPMLPLRIDWYVTVLDLGAWGAVYTGGWDRQVISTGQAAKETKRTINGQRIYPPLTGKREDILIAAAPVIAQPPTVVTIPNGQ